jgi:hypothetical protein
VSYPHSNAAKKYAANAFAPRLVCRRAVVDRTGKTSPGRTLGPVVNGSLGEGDVGALDTEPFEVVDGVGSASPLVHAASNPAISAIAANRIRTAT